MKKLVNVEFYLQEGLIKQMGEMESFSGSDFITVIELYKFFRQELAFLDVDIANMIEKLLSDLQRQLNEFLNLLRETVKIPNEERNEIALKKLEEILVNYRKELEKVYSVYRKKDSSKIEEIENKKDLMKNNYEYDVAFSFAGEDREYVEKVAELLKDKIRIFYDRFVEFDLWGKNLYEHLSEVYSKKSKYVVMFISEYYSKKLWTNHERQSAQERAFNENREYILPSRFDNTKIPGVLETTGYIDLTKINENKFAEIILKKIKEHKTEIHDESFKANLEEKALNQKIYKSDIELYLKIKEKIKNSIEFTKNWDFGSSHRNNSLNDLFEIELEFESPDYEFINEEIEIINEFISCVSVNTFPKGNDFQEIPYEWRIEKPELFEKTRNTLNSLANKMWRKYCDFVKMGRIILEI